MKTRILITALVCCTQLSVLANSQKNFSAEFSAMAGITTPLPQTTTASFSFVRGHKQGKNTAITWGMNNNSGITHFMVECTYEDPTDPYSVWRTVGMLPCTPRSPIFKMIDSPFLPGTLNYRIIAFLDNNSTVVSEIYTTYVQ